MAKKPAKPVKKKTVPKKTAPKKVAPKKSAAKKAVPKKTAPKKAVPGKTVKKTVKKGPAAAPKKTVRKVSSSAKPATAPKRPEKAAPRPPIMKKDDVLRKQLIGMREEIVKEAKTEIGKYIKGETRQLVESVLDDGDWSVIDLNEDINLRRLATHREMLLKIDEALRKIREETYGKCEDCGEEINTERLKVLPFAIYCRDCQEKREEFEKMEGEEL
ncbi:MAG TPA: TraR/DksA C4-type zinc finger protein [Thermodesulfovibrionales bacterium]|nr:TraR/DksA C4-type zinc finger protein [Thermodesulfovibrionales bacterium]